MPYAVEFDNYNVKLHNCILWAESTIKDCHGYWCGDSELELVKPFKKADLKEGDRITTRNGKTYTHNVNDDFFIDSINEYLTNNGRMGKELDIVKVERPTYTTVYEREEEEVKEMTLKEVCDKLGCNIKIIKEV